MTDRVKRPDKYGRHPIATIPDEQIERLKFVLFHTDSSVTLESVAIQKGDNAKVTRGSLMGITGYVEDINGCQVQLLICLGTLGTVKVSLNSTDVEKEVG